MGGMYWIDHHHHHHHHHHLANVELNRFLTRSGLTPSEVSSLVPSAFWSVVFYYPGQSVTCCIQFLLYSRILTKT